MATTQNIPADEPQDEAAKAEAHAKYLEAMTGAPGTTVSGTEVTQPQGGISGKLHDVLSATGISASGKTDVESEFEELPAEAFEQLTDEVLDKFFKEDCGIPGGLNAVLDGRIPDDVMAEMDSGPARVLDSDMERIDTDELANFVQKSMEEYIDLSSLEPEQRVSVLALWKSYAQQTAMELSPLATATAFKLMISPSVAMGGEWGDWEEMDEGTGENQEIGSGGGGAVEPEENNPPEEDTEGGEEGGKKEKDKNQDAMDGELTSSLMKAAALVATTTATEIAVRAGIKDKTLVGKAIEGAVLGALCVGIHFIVVALRTAGKTAQAVANLSNLNLKDVWEDEPDSQAALWTATILAPLVVGLIDKVFSSDTVQSACRSSGYTNWLTYGNTRRVKAIAVRGVMRFAQVLYVMRAF